MNHWPTVVQMAYAALKNTSKDTELLADLEVVIDEMLLQQKFLLPNWRNLEKPIVTVDFDGVISEYKHGWRGVAAIMDEKPVPGAIDWLEQAVKEFTVLIFSSRCNDQNGIRAIRKWLLINRLTENTLNQLFFQPGKPSAFMMLDDRAIQFSGDFKEPAHIKEDFKPWYYRVPGWRNAQEQTAAETD